ncbi:MAG: monovalent cation/H+ antiporter complex subunit F [Hymenobacteraceae bacterium]|nr:monovalent cation/H+ antiporter complex subunit F [Hymenobacteraceae bacterium]MDX5397614.1 monovalent cation/H+ antiporter complex subunit F [Hymenobacteraceae bacterium]MDX5443860.1 monovalent cation/H+ antiporter complex subunit F [Hymenobacteraceae bacterium]MDX5513694.1 monovalent cation/H+ antiporter complex subunit F [Hymenobacteraceae bacterium]
MLLVLVRFLKGPSLPDRISAFDLFAANIIAIIAIYSELTNDESILDVAIILSLFTFLGAISFAYYLTKK